LSDFLCYRTMGKSLFIQPYVLGPKTQQTFNFSGK
jgi:hypothetical protein